MRLAAAHSRSAQQDTLLKHINLTSYSSVVLLFLIRLLLTGFTTHQCSEFVPSWGRFLLLGLLIPYKEIPVWWSWFAWICPLRYAWSALMMNEFDENDPFNALGYFSVGDSSQKWNYFGYTCAFYPVFFLGTYVIMSFRKFVKR